MQKKANNMVSTTSTSIRDSVNALKKTGSDSSLAEIKPSELAADEKSKNCNTLPMQSSAKNSDSSNPNNNGKVNGSKVKFSTLPSPNKASAKTAKVYETDIL